MQSSIELIIGGEKRVFASALTVAELVAELDLEGKRIAIELNGEIVPRSRFLQTSLHSGDRLEIVTAVGGG